MIKEKKCNYNKSKYSIKKLHGRKFTLPTLGI